MSKYIGLVWRHKRYKTTFVGHYGYNLGGKSRFFFLESESVSKVFEFESPQAARKAGWISSK